MIVQLSPGLDERDDLRQKILNPWVLRHCRKRRLTSSLSLEEGRDINPNRTSFRQKNLQGCLPGYFTSRSQLIPQTGSTPHFPGASTPHQATWSKQTAVYAEKYRAGTIVFLEVAPPPVSLTFRQQENVA